jgi:hypothetical protein
MKNDIDQIAKDIFADSKLELTNPHFNSMILSKISLDLERKVKQKVFAVYTLIFSTIAIAACLVLTIFKIDVLGQIVSITSSDDFESLLKTISENAYCILPLLLLLIGKKVALLAPKYSNSNLSVK